MTDVRTLEGDVRRLKQAVHQLVTSATNQADNIAALAASATSQAGQITALSASLAAVNAKEQRVGVSLPTLAVGATDVTVTWPVAWPDTAYGVWISILAGTATVPALHATLKAGTKTTVDCVVTIVNSTAGVVATGIDVLGIRT